MTSTPLDEITTILIAPLGAPGTGVAPSQWTTIRSDVDGLLALPGITKLDDVPDVNVAGVTDGLVLAYDSASGLWKPVAVNEAVAFIKNGDATTVVYDADRLNFLTSGFTVVQNGTRSTQADIGILYGTTANTVASGDHSHNQALLNRWTFAATGTISSGTRTLLSQSSYTAVNGITYNSTAKLVVTGKNDINNGTVRISLRIGTDPAVTRTMQTVGGVPHELIVEDERTFVGGGTPLTITATIAYDSGDSTDVRDGYVTFRAWPNR